MGSQITTATPIAGYTWNLWKGPNANWEVLSFVASSQINSFDVDLKAFFGMRCLRVFRAVLTRDGCVDYLVASQGVSASQVIHSPFTRQWWTDVQHSTFNRSRLERKLSLVLRLS